MKYSSEYKYHVYECFNASFVYAGSTILHTNIIFLWAVIRENMEYESVRKM